MSNSPTDSDVVLEARGIFKSFPGVQALADVSVQIRRGRVHAVTGENGAGKSTLMGILAGALTADAGEILIDGRRAEFRSPGEARAAGIATVFQELNLVPQLTVAQNVFLGREPLTHAGMIDDARMQREAADWMQRAGIGIAPQSRVADLRVGQQQLVEIARALSMSARVIILDEPTSAITDREAAALQRLVLELVSSGVAIIYITHKLAELSAIADDVTVMRDGRCVASQPADSLARHDIVRMMVGRSLSDAAPRTRTEPGTEVLRVEGLHLAHPDRENHFVLNDVSLHLRRGEVLGIFGLLGAGRTELFEALFGMHPNRARGHIAVDGKRVWFSSPREAIDAGLALAPEDRKRDGLVLPLSVAANTSLASIDRVERLGLLDSARENDLANEYVRRLHIKTPSVADAVQNLSGGNQQKVVLAKWLATEPKILLLDEPTRGIDIGAKEELHSLLDELVASGLGVIFVSSELPEVLALADRILVMAEGRKTAEFTRSTANEENVMNAALGATAVQPGAPESGKAEAHAR